VDTKKRIQRPQKMNCLICGAKSIKLILEEENRVYWRCEFCLFISLDNKFRLSPSEEKYRYEQHNNNIHDENYRLFLSKLFKPLKDKLKIEAKGLDFGCGPGPALAEMFKEEGFRMDLYDPFFFNNSIVFNRAYDFITCTEAIEHFFEPIKEFKKIDALLIKKGFVGVMTNFLSDEKDFSQWYYRKDPTHVAFYSPKTLEVIASMMNWTYEIPEKDVVIFKK